MRHGANKTSEAVLGASNSPVSLVSDGSQYRCLIALKCGEL